MPVKPAAICANETLLTNATQSIALAGYGEVHRLDRRANADTCGTLIIAATDVAASIKFLSDGGELDERAWATMHAMHGTYILSAVGIAPRGRGGQGS